MAGQLAILRQSGVIAYRVDGDQLKVLLVTSRDTGRWIIPKGNVSSRSTSIAAAKSEAFEEAGIKGVIDSEIPLGSYAYVKRLNDGSTAPAIVEVFLLRMTRQHAKWPEKGERRLAWLSLADAEERLGEPGLLPLLARLVELERLLIDVAKASEKVSARA